MRPPAPLFALVLLASSSPSLSQQAPAPPAEIAVPVLRAGTGPDARPLPLAKAEVRATVHGFLAETTLVLTFRNDEDRVLEGELVFPLLEGATVSGFGLDVGGVMVDGVPVEKQQARVSYETEVRKGIDPGLIEHVAGNNFRTRVYPIPARGARTVKVQYVSDMGGANGRASHVIPLHWKQKVGGCALRFEVVGHEAKPTVRGGPEGLAFQQKDGRWVAEASAKDAQFGDLIVELAAVPDRHVAVERRTKKVWTVEELAERERAGIGEKAEHYFVIHDTPAGQQNAGGDNLNAARIGVLWDASLSREAADKAAEFQLLSALLGRLGRVRVDLIVFRDTADEPVTFDITDGNSDKLIEHLKGLTYDGATNLGTVRTDQPGRSFYLLFTDGVSNLGPEMPKPATVPVYAVSNAAEANHALLRHVAQESGGAYFNLRRGGLDGEALLRTIGQPPFSLVSVEHKPGEVADVSPRPGTPVQGRVAVSGRLLVPEATVTLNYGHGKDRITHRQAFTLRQAGATETGLVPRFWAQQRVADLSVFPDRHADELLRLGREFVIVTPNTSLIVLETAEQYVQHRIVPPKTRPDVYTAFMAQIERRKADEGRTHEQRVQRALAMWNERVKWWETKFEYPPNFAYKEPPKAPVTEVAAGVGGAVAGRELRRLNETAAADAPAPRPAPAATRGESAVRVRAEDLMEQAQGRPAQPARPRGRAAPAETAADPSNATPEEIAQVERRSGSSAGRGGRADRFGSSGGHEFAQGAVVDSRDGSAPATVPAPALPGQTYYAGVRVTDPAGAPADSVRLDGDGDAAGPAIAVRAWDPDTPYLKAMRAAGPAKAYGVYLEQRKAFGAAPAFYLDCGDFLLRNGQKELGVRVLSNIAELHLEDARLLRIVAHRLSQIEEANLAIGLFERVLKLRPEEPQSSRDLALALAGRAHHWATKGFRDDASQINADFRRSLELLNKVVMDDWDRFEGIQVTALMEANHILAQVGRLSGQIGPVANPLDTRLTKLLDLDVRIVLTWDTDLTDVDLWVTEPSGEKCFYSHNRTTIGGLLSTDFTQGYGPEEYCLRRLMPGRYTIRANFYGSREVQLVGPTTVQATIITNFGRPDERRQSLTVRLAGKSEVVEIGTVTLGAPQAK